MVQSRSWSALLLLSTMLLSFLPTASSAADTIIFVKSGGSGSQNGTSWENAYGDIQLALASAVPNSAIWVAAGTYKPSGSNRSTSFVLPLEVAIYGGFAGTETLLTARDLQANPTILSGDLGGDDGPNGAVIGENSFHVVRSTSVAASTRLDGFTISGGNANGAGFPDNVGGGIYNSSSSPTLANLTISGNTASNFGGGMYNDFSSPALTNVTLSGNTASNSGGGVYNDFSSPTLTNVTLSGNTASNSGGGMYNNSSSSPTLTNLTISGNSASNDGGGIFNSASSPVLTDATISGNIASDDGGGIFNSVSSSPVLTNVTISSNTASDDGGGIFNSSSSPTLTRVTLRSNSANDGGGIFNNNSTSSLLRNLTVSGNTALGSGGGMFNNNSNPKLTNVTVSGNRAGISGGGMFNSSARYPDVRNSIVWGNAPDAIFGTTTTVQDSLIEGGYVGTGNLAVDPQFLAPIDPNSTPPSAGDLRLRPSSPAIDAGDDTALPADLATDRDGNPRRVDVPEVGSNPARTIDLGAYEAPVLLVLASTLLDANPTTAAEVRFLLTFSAPVIGVDLADLSLTSVGVVDAATIAVVGSGTTYTATVGTGTGVGTLRLDVLASATIADASGYPLGGLPYTSGAFYTRGQEIIGTISTLTTLVASPNPVTVGQAVTLTATITAASGTPGGSVEFRDGTAILGSANLDATGQGTLIISNFSLGTHTLIAIYSGNSTFAGSSSSPLSLVVQPGPSESATLTVYLPLVLR